MNPLASERPVAINVERTAPGHAILRRVGALDVAVPDDAAGAALALLAAIKPEVAA